MKEFIQNEIKQYAPISSFLKAKESGTLKPQEERMFEYPIQFENKMGFADTGWIQDVEQFVSEIYRPVLYEVIIIILLADKVSISKIRKRCCVPVGSEPPNWDVLHCQYAVAAFDNSQTKTY